MPQLAEPTILTNIWHPNNVDYSNFNIRKLKYWHKGQQERQAKTEKKQLLQIQTVTNLARCLVILYHCGHQLSVLMF